MVLPIGRVTLTCTKFAAASLQADIFLVILLVLKVMQWGSTAVFGGKPCYAGHNVSIYKPFGGKKNKKVTKRLMKYAMPSVYEIPTSCDEVVMSLWIQIEKGKFNMLKEQENTKELAK